MQRILNKGLFVFVCLQLASCQGTLLGRLWPGGKSSGTAVPAPSVERTPEPKTSSVGHEVFSVYDETTHENPKFIPSGRMGDWGDIRFDSLWHSGAQGTATCIRVEYLARATQGNGWAGMYWQHPAGNWGQDEDGGLNFEGAKRLVFWARGETGREVISKFMMGGIQGKFPDSDHVVIGPIYLEKAWKRYEISLKDKQLPRIAGGFAWTADIEDNKGGAVFYLDEIRYEW